MRDLLRAARRPGPMSPVGETNFDDGNQRTSTRPTVVVALIGLLLLAMAGCDRGSAEGQQRAAETATEWLEQRPGSRTKLIEALTSERKDGDFKPFSKKDATAAVDSLNIDWNANAVASAEGLLALDLGFSRIGLINFLSSEYEGYTVEEATYAADHVTVDWDEQAVLVAEDELESAPYGLSRADLVSSLTDPDTGGFTVEQADAAIDGLNVDWDEQAAIAAERIGSDGRRHTCDEVVEELTHEFFHEFTREQAEAGAKIAGFCE